jgi:hypothetical protein
MEVNCRLVSKLFFFPSYGEKSNLIGFFWFFP